MNRSSFCSKLKQDYATNNTSTRNMAQKYYGFRVNSYKGSIGSYDYKNKNDQSYSEEDLMGSGFPWPPRNYTCSFCKREFRSAQALGGHMNVHRRDRARLRQYSPPGDACGDCDDNGNCNNNNNDGHQVSSFNLSADTPNPSLNANPISNHRFLGNSCATFSSSLTTRSPSTFASPFPSIPCSLSGNNSNIKKQGSGDKDVADEGFRLITKDLIQMKAAYKGLYEKEYDHKKDFVRLDLEIGLTSIDDRQCKEELDLELRLGYY